MVNPGDVVVLVIPIDSSAPKGRIILPQQMVLRDLLDAHAAALACQPGELAGLLGSLARPPKLVVTDSQVFSQVAAIVPPEVPLTSFSVLMARRKGQLSLLIEGANALGGLTGESRVLVCEGCTHHRQCEDIGTVKMPAWIKAFCGAEPQFEFVSGKEFPDSLEGYDLVVHCGGCMLNGREMRYRLDKARAYGVPGRLRLQVRRLRVWFWCGRPCQPFRGFAGSRGWLRVSRGTVAIGICLTEPRIIWGKGRI